MLLTLVWILIGNSVSLSVGGIEDLRPRRWVRAVVLIVAIAINLVKLEMSITKVFFAMSPVMYAVQVSLISNAVKVSLKHPFCTDTGCLLPARDSEQLLEKIGCS